MSKVDIFIVHSIEDKEKKDELLLHLSSQKEGGKVSFWDRDLVLSGQEENKVLEENLLRSDIILFLISADFYNCGYCQSIEHKAFKVEKTQNLVLVPIMLRHFDLGAKYDSRTTLPERNKPILGRHWHSEDEAFNYVATRIEDVIDKRVEGRKSTHLKPPTTLKIIQRKIRRPAGIFGYLGVLVLCFLLLLLPKQNLPIDITMEVNELNFQLIEKKGKGIWSDVVDLKQAALINYSEAIIPSKGIRFYGDSSQLIAIPEGQVSLNKLTSSLDATLYLMDSQLSLWDIADSSKVRLKKYRGSPLVVGVKGGHSSGEFSYTDNLEFYTENSVLKMGEIEYRKDLEARIYSSNETVKFKYNESDYSMHLDFKDDNFKGSNLQIDELTFYKDSRNKEGTPSSTILSGKINFSQEKLIEKEIPETYFLNIDNIDPIEIRNIRILNDRLELVIRCSKVKDVQIGPSLSDFKSISPSRLEWFTNKYQLGILAGLLAFLSPIFLFFRNMIKKKVNKDII